ncbi:holo-[acyl-carrier protein] synthase [Ruminiclostridium sufflavum DSM 19573]|uniref:Holo-[acyl-carrier-protein] synthase n=1 Tax=Ruminiclostridium sufflavum DSM 19573 TaxID=1121337 RepID=A0A318XMD8_9FIRM|nr:holo-ACP synthase [Ruminiclostridium sufflavum]PYG89022.1 holo-[acyl-carrier protein] synthase [Ruminiclostridium sufflavum DSM 19573]
MKLLVGTDIIEIDRVKAAIEKSKSGRFLERVFTEDEINYCESRNTARYESYAARFAGKEAVSKAFGTGICSKAALNEIEILNDSLGKPFVALYGGTRKYFNEIGAPEISISLSHCKEYAVAYVSILVEKGSLK